MYKVSNLKIPIRYRHLTEAIINSMPVKLLELENGCLVTRMFSNLEEFLKSNNPENFIGPFSDRLGEKDCFRFESLEAARYLSN